MFRMTQKTILTRALLAALPLLCAATTGRAYVDLAPSFSKIVSDAPSIMVVEVTSYDRGTHSVSLKPLQAIKGALATETIVHQIAPDGGSVPRQVVQWAVPGSRAVVFAGRNTALVCFGTNWYQVRQVGTGPWKLGAERPDLPLAYCGSMSRLVDATKALARNESGVITVVAFGADSEGASFDLALNRQSLPGVVRVQRMHVTPNMPGNVMGSSSNPTFFIGVGVVDDTDIPALLEHMKSPDATTRMEAVEDLRTLGKKAKNTTPELTALLKDPSPQVRYAAASTLLKMDAKNAAASDVLKSGLSASNASDRRYAAACAGYTGKGGEAFAEKLTALLKDSDEAVRLTALESITMLGTPR